MRKTYIFVLILIAVSATGCTGFRSSQYDREIEGGYMQHRVSYPGETLGLIADWYTGSISNWKKIAEHNPNLDIYRMRVGDTVLIPNVIVVQKAKFPESVVSSEPVEGDLYLDETEETNGVSIQEREKKIRSGEKFKSREEYLDELLKE